VAAACRKAVKRLKPGEDSPKDSDAARMAPRGRLLVGVSRETRWPVWIEETREVTRWRARLDPYERLLLSGSIRDGWRGRK